MPVESSFESIRAVTGWVRPTAGHGCKPCEVAPGIWTAHYHDVDTPEKLSAVAGGKIQLIVNSAVCQCDSRPGHYGPGVEVVLVDLEVGASSRNQAAARRPPSSESAPLLSPWSPRRRSLSSSRPSTNPSTHPLPPRPLCCRGCVVRPCDSVGAVALQDDPDARKKFDSGATGAVSALPFDEPTKNCAGDAKRDFARVSAAIDRTLEAGGATLIHCHARCVIDEMRSGRAASQACHITRRCGGRTRRGSLASSARGETL